MRSARTIMWFYSGCFIVRLCPDPSGGTSLVEIVVTSSSALSRFLGILREVKVAGNRS